MARLLIIDDEAKLLRLLERLFLDEGHQVTTAARAEDAEARLRQAEFDLLITDVRLPRRSGLDLLRAARELQPDLEVVVMSAYGTVHGAVEAMRLGAFDYLLKPFELDGLRLVAERALERRRFARENRYLRAEIQGGPGRGLVAESPAMRRVVHLVERVAPTDTTVLLLGESGVGKELVAETLHALSPRAEHPLIRVNCPAIPRDLMESELFGHQRGAFTGAEGARAGKFELADGGTLFLDEIGDLPLAQQGKLLNVLESRRFSRVGSAEEIEVDVRILAATNRDLERAVAEGRFRADLFFRLAVLPITIPPLRERPEDLPGLVRELCARLGPRLGRPRLALDPALLPALRAYAWPGNVRELRNLLERAAVLSSEDVLRQLDLPNAACPEPACPSHSRQPAQVAGDLNADVEAYKRARLLAALRQTGWRKKEAADLLGLSARALSHYLERYQLEDERGEGA
ncbi:MAG: sigma-54 dependent transcriptional regulator [Pseudomonadota bacterium]